MNRSLVLALMRRLALMPTDTLMMPEKTLFDEVMFENRCGSGDLRSAITFARGKGWVEDAVDDFGVRKWRLTAAGRAKLRDLSE